MLSENMELFGWACGENGAILKYEGAHLITNTKKKLSVPNRFKLWQNYPNPFNPATKIKFALPKSGFTKIVIYDLLGRETRTLINQEVEAGYHELLFDASNLSGGVYFYKIESGEFQQTKKMIVLK